MTLLLKILEKYARLGLLLTLLVFFLCLSIIPKLSIESDIIKQLPPDHPAVKDFTRIISTFGTLDLLIVVLEKKSHTSDEDLYNFAETLAQNYQELPLVSTVEYRIPDPWQYFQKILRHLVAIADDKEWEAIQGRLEPQALRHYLSFTARRALGFTSSSIKEWLKRDPLNFLEIFQERFLQNMPGLTMDLASGYFLSRDHQYLIILLRPLHPAQDITFTSHLMSGVTLKTGKAKKMMVKRGYALSELPSIHFTGGYPVVWEDGSLIKGDMLRNMVTSFIGVLLLFYVAFRRFSSLIYAFFPILTGLVLTFAFATLFLKEVNAASSAFAALLIGLSIDFVIIGFGRFVEAMKQGKGCLKSCSIFISSTYPPIFLGAITTAATFGAFLLTHLPGLKELGLLTATGILFCMVSVFVLLPILLYLGWKNPRGNLYLHSFGTHYLVGLAQRHPKKVLVLSASITLFAFWGALHLPYVDDAQALRSPHNKAVKLRERITQAFGTNFSPMLILIQAPDATSLMEEAHKLKFFLDELVDQKILMGHKGIYDYFPPLSLQKERIEKRKGRIPQGWERDFRAICRQLNLNDAIFEPFLTHFREGLIHPEPLTWEAFPHDDPLLSKMVVPTEHALLTLSTLYPKGDRWRRDPPPVLEQWVNEHPTMTLSGVNILSRGLRTLSLADAKKATLLGTLLVCFLLWLHFKRLSRMLLSLVPLGVGILWMLGTMQVFNVPLNSMNIFVTLMIIGIGVDYGIHMVHRYFETPDPGALASTGNAIAVAALSTMVGFGTLSLSNFPGIASMGMVALLGAFYCSLVSVTLLVALMKLWVR